MSDKEKYSASFKAQVLLEAIRGKIGIEELAKRYSVTSSQVIQWKQEALDKLPAVFDKKGGMKDKNERGNIGALAREKRRLEIELAFVKRAFEKLDEKRGD